MLLRQGDQAIEIGDLQQGNPRIDPSSGFEVISIEHPSLLECWNQIIPQTVYELVNPALKRFARSSAAGTVLLDNCAEEGALRFWERIVCFGQHLDIVCSIRPCFPSWKGLRQRT